MLVAIMKEQFTEGKGAGQVLLLQRRRLCLLLSKYIPIWSETSFDYLG